jgi:prepilin-type N-terminal cleavage/methylation domain-containing protein
MIVHRGLTLLEVLLASAILATLAVACVPLLHESLTALVEPPEPTFDLNELADVADQFLADPTRFGMADSRQLLEQGSVTITWPASKGDHEDETVIPHLPPINVRCLLADDSKVDHAWALFECDGQTIARWIAMPHKEPVAP